MSLTPIAQKYICDPSQVTETPAQNIEQLRNLDSSLRSSFEKQKADHDAFKLPDPNRVLSRFRQVVKILGSYLSEVLDRVFDHVKTQTRELVQSNIQLIDYLQKNPNKTIDVAKYRQESIAQMQSDPQFKRYIWMKTAIENKLGYLAKNHPANSPNKMIKITLQKTLIKYDPNEKYVPNSPFDIVLPYFVEQPKYKSMMKSTIDQITEQSVKSSLVTIAEMSSTIKSEICKPQDAFENQYVIYIGLVRYLFAESYLEKPTLAMNNKANMEFLHKCTLFSNATVQSLALPQSIKKSFTPHLPVRSIFKDNLLKSMNGIDFMTNPVDIMIRISRARLLILKTFQGLKPNEAKTVLTVLIALNPPMNAVAIAVFLKKWADIALTDDMKTARDMFIESVQLIYELNDDDDEEEDGGEAVE
ncbi:hypothetical protein M9Y10_044653 [Tritrichomonas musculus]|uniref:Uncharacterized protein n=1 Tax=Tritrichomonas musculus TaxID=1915356 RepID=A0ABR2JSY8_9EUKA